MIRSKKFKFRESVFLVSEEKILIVEGKNKFWKKERLVVWGEGSKTTGGSCGNRRVGDEEKILFDLEKGDKF